MSDVVIQVDSLWKKYRLGVLGTGTLRHDFNRWLHRLAGKPDPYAKVGEGQKSEERRAKSEDSSSPSSLSSLHSPSSSLRDDEMWALRDISFEVKQGEILGIIGRNGAGKSTLLKILSRVTAPTNGEVRVKGRIASLLEVGTGFHPELTGRENIFLNGTILGMTKAEIKGKLDEIVAFAEVEKFIDTPVKRYSSGMYVRLAFAVAAHLEPEILIVDEVLAVGDAEFQKKCLGKMQSVSTEEGRTVLFVSHNMGAVTKLCQRAVLLQSGKLTCNDTAEVVVQEYLRTSARPDRGNIDLSGFRPRFGNGPGRILRARLLDSTGVPSGTYTVGDCITVQFLVDYGNQEPGRLTHCVEVANSNGVPLLHLWDIDSRQERPVSRKIGWVSARLTDVNFFPDTFDVSLWLGNSSGKGMEDYVPNCLSFEITQDLKRIPRPLAKNKGLIWRLAEWSYSTGSDPNLTHS